MSRFVFLDRDGTLVRDTGYPHRAADYALLPGVAEGLRALAGAGFRLAIVTNQSGLGRGLFAEADYHAFQALLRADLARAGVELAASFFCPHTPEDACACRKPKPGLLLRARDELGAQLAQSFLVGDRARDAEAANNAGCRGSVLVGEAGEVQNAGRARNALPRNTVRAPNFRAAAAHILSRLE